MFLSKFKWAAVLSTLFSAAVSATPSDSELLKVIEERINHAVRAQLPLTRVSIHLKSYSQSGLVSAATLAQDDRLRAAAERNYFRELSQREDQSDLGKTTTGSVLTGALFGLQKGLLSRVIDSRGGKFLDLVSADSEVLARSHAQLWSSLRHQYSVFEALKEIENVSGSKILRRPFAQSSTTGLPLVMDEGVRGELIEAALNRASARRGVDVAMLKRELPLAFPTWRDADSVSVMMKHQEKLAWERIPPDVRAWVVQPIQAEALRGWSRSREAFVSNFLDPRRMFEIAAELRTAGNAAFYEAQRSFDRSRVRTDFSWAQFFRNHPAYRARRYVDAGGGFVRGVLMGFVVGVLLGQISDTELITSVVPVELNPLTDEALLISRAYLGYATFQAANLADVRRRIDLNQCSDLLPCTLELPVLDVVLSTARAQLIKEKLSLSDLKIEAAE